MPEVPFPPTPSHVHDDEPYLVHRPDPLQTGISALERRLREAENALAEAFDTVGNDVTRARLFARTAEDYAVEVALDPDTPPVQRGDAREVLSGVKQLRTKADRIDPPEYSTTDAAKAATAERFTKVVNRLAQSDFPATTRSDFPLPPPPPTPGQNTLTTRPTVTVAQRNTGVER